MTNPVPTAARTEAFLALRAAGQLPVGRERIAMLEAVAAHGSITAAARALGYSYKAVWDGLNAINNLLPSPALSAHSGGRGGGGAQLTEAGRRLIGAFHRLEEKLAEASALLAAEADTPSIDLLFWSVVMKTSARNALYGRVTALTEAAVNAEVVLEVAPGRTVTAVITRHSAEALGLVPGREVVALIKSSFVLLAPAGEVPALSVANRIPGTVAERVDDGVNSEITLRIGGGKTLTAVITRASADALGLSPGVGAVALFDAAHVILATG